MADVIDLDGERAARTPDYLGAMLGWPTVRREGSGQDSTWYFWAVEDGADLEADRRRAGELAEETLAHALTLRDQHPDLIFLVTRAALDAAMHDLTGSRTAGAFLAHLGRRLLDGAATTTSS
jgi:hypothetical protein